MNLYEIMKGNGMLLLLYQNLFSLLFIIKKKK